MTSHTKSGQQQPEVSKLRIPNITRQFSRGSASGGGGITDSTSQPEMTSLTAARTFEDFAKEANGGEGPKIASRSYVDGRRGRSKKSAAGSPYNKMTSSATMMTSSHSSSSHVAHMDMINDVITINASRSNSFRLKSVVVNNNKQDSDNSNSNKPPINNLLQQQTQANKMMTSSTTIALKPTRHVTNHCIQAIKRGIPDTLSNRSADNEQQRSYRVSTSQALKITERCICQPRRSGSVSGGSWIFSCCVFTVCVLCPLLSFISDLIFYGMCSYLDNRTQLILDRTNLTLLIPPLPPPALVTSRRRDIRSASSASRGVRHHGAGGNDVERLKRVNESSTPTVTMATTTSSLTTLTTMSGIELLINVTSYTDDYIDDGGIPPVMSSPLPPLQEEQICDTKIEIYKLIASKEGRDKFERHRHFIFNVFLPVLVVGTFPSFLLCIFIRLVVLLTSHDHFLSAYVMNLVSMSLQIVIAPISVYIAGFHFGSRGFSCWYCMVEDEDKCPLASSFYWQSDHITYSLIISLSSKVLDGIAGGIMLLVVLCRTIWERYRNKIIWWYLGRALLTIAAFAFCIVTSPLMVLTPAVGIFRKEFLEKVVIDEKSPVVLTIFVVGAGMWMLTVTVITLFITYRTYIYCRVEDLADQSFR